MLRNHTILVSSSTISIPRRIQKHNTKYKFQYVGISSLIIYFSYFKFQCSTVLIHLCFNFNHSIFFVLLITIFLKPKISLIIFSVNKVAGSDSVIITLYSREYSQSYELIKYSKFNFNGNGNGHHPLTQMGSILHHGPLQDTPTHHPLPFVLKLKTKFRGIFVI